MQETSNTEEEENDEDHSKSLVDLVPHHPVLWASLRMMKSQDEIMNNHPLPLPLHLPALVSIS